MELPHESPSPEPAAAEQSSSSFPPGGLPPSSDGADPLVLTLPDDAATPREIGLWAGVIVLLTLAVYWPSTDGPLLWTDLLRNANPGDLSTIWLRRWADPAHYPLSQYHPLTFTLDWFIYNVFGRDSHGNVLPFGYHLVSLILHCGAAVLLWRVLYKLRLPGAWTAAMLFAVLPINAEAVAWISQLGTLLAGALAIGSIYCYLRFREQESDGELPATAERWAWYAGSAGLYVLAMLSKTTAWAVPLITLAALAWRRRARTRDTVLLLPWMIVGVALAATAAIYERQVFTNAGDNSAWTLPMHAIVIGRTFWFYLGKMLLPIGLSVLYPVHAINPGQASEWVPLVAMLAVFGLAIVLAVKVRGPLAALIGYVAALAPAMGAIYLITMRNSLYADHQAYLASAAVMAGVVGAVSTALRQLGRRDRTTGAPSTPAAVNPASGVTPAVVLAAVVIVLAGGAALVHSRVFASSVRLWSDVVAKDPESAFAHNRLALADAEAGELAQRDGDTETATPLMNSALDEARRAAQLDPNNGEAQSTWGRLLSSRQQDAGAIEHLSKAVALSPKLMEPRVELAAVYLRDKQIPAAVREADAALEVQPQYPITHRILGEAYDQLGQTPRAISEQQQELGIDPNDLRSREDLANLLSRTGDDTDAITVLRDYFTLRPDAAKADPQLWNAIGKLTARTGDMDKAIAYFKAALALDPTMTEASHNLDLAQGALEKQRKAAATRAATQAAAQAATAPTTR